MRDGESIIIIVGLRMKLRFSQALDVIPKLFDSMSSWRRWRGDENVVQEGKIRYFGTWLAKKLSTYIS